MGPPSWIWPPARNLGAVARVVADEWGVVLGKPYEGARFSFAAPADGAVLKVTPVEDDEADHAPDALAAWNGTGAVRLLRRDDERRAMLIERAIPGDDASTIADEDAITIAIEVGRQLWRQVDAGRFRNAGDEVRRWLAAVASTGHRFVPIAERIFAEMELRHEVLVHGDYHHHNLLRHGDRWVAIDPAPLLAEPEFDVVTLLWNPLGVEPTRERVHRRIAALVASGLDERRIRDWAIVRGTYLGLPLDPGQNESTVPQLQVVANLVDLKPQANP